MRSLKSVSVVGLIVLTPVGFESVKRVSGSGQAERRAATRLVPRRCRRVQRAAAEAAAHLLELVIRDPGALAPPSRAAGPATRACRTAVTSLSLDSTR